MERSQKFVTSFKTSRCDVCGTVAVGLMTEADGRPVFFACSTCVPRTWEAEGERAKDAWLDAPTDADRDR